MSSVSVGEMVRMSFRVMFVGFARKEEAVALLKTIKSINISWLNSAS